MTKRRIAGFSRSLMLVLWFGDLRLGKIGVDEFGLARIAGFAL